MKSFLVLREDSKNLLSTDYFSIVRRYYAWCSDTTHKQTYHTHIHTHTHALSAISKKNVKYPQVPKCKFSCALLANRHMSNSKCRFARTNLSQGHMIQELDILINYSPDEIAQEELSRNEENWVTEFRWRGRKSGHSIATQSNDLSIW